LFSGPLIWLFLRRGEKTFEPLPEDEYTSGD